MLLFIVGSVQAEDRATRADPRPHSLTVTVIPQGHIQHVSCPERGQFYYVPRCPLYILSDGFMVIDGESSIYSLYVPVNKQMLADEVCA